MFGFSAFGQAPFASLGVSGPQLYADVSESVSAADSTVVLNISFGITETLSASNQQTSQANFFPQVVEADTVAADNISGGYLLPVDQTDSVTAADSVYQDQFAWGAAISESATPTDAYNYVYIPGGPITEALAADSTQVVTSFVANAYISNISPFLDTITSPTWATQKIDSPIASNNYGKGLKFIANKTQTLSSISVGAFSVYNNLINSSTSVTNGSVQLWQLDSNSLSGNPYQLLASKEFNVNDLPNPISSLTTITNSLLGAAALSSVTTPSTGNNDDGYYAITLPWNVNYLGVSYSTINVCTNNYLTFGAGAQTYSGFSSVGPSVPKLCMGANDNSWQRVYYGTEGTAPNRTYRVVYEGTASTAGTLGSPTIVWEAVFYENNPSQIDVQIGANAAGVGQLWGVYTADAKVGVFPSTTTNVGIRLISKPVGQGVVSPALPVTFDFSSSPVTLTSGVGYAVTFTTGDWVSSNRYASLYKINTLYGVATGLSAAVVPAANLLEYNYLLGSCAPISYQGASTSWFAPFSDTEINSFSVKTVQDTSATDSISPASSTYYNARTETGSAVDSTTGNKFYIGVFSENSAISALVDLSLFSQYSTAVFPGSLTDGWGIKFVAQKTGQLGSIGFNPLSGAVSVVGSGAVTAGEIRLYQLSTNTLSGTPTTLIATKSIYLTSTTDLLNGLNDGFTNVSGASVTAGVGYAITFYKGSDWSYPTCYMNNIGLIADNSVSSRYYSSTYVGLGGNGIPYMMVGYATTATDTAAAVTLPQTEYRLETVTAADTQINNRQTVGYTGLNNTSGEPVFSTWTGAQITNGTLPTNNSGGGFFETFIANSTSSVSSVKIHCSSWGNFSAPTTNGYVQIWQLNSNTLGGIPTTLLGQVSFKPSNLLTSPSFVNFDFSSLGISLTSGVGYAVGAITGSDWNYTTTDTINFYIASVVNPIGDSAGFASYSGSTWNVDPTGSTRLRMAIFSSNSTVDVVNGSPVSGPNMQESVSAIDTNVGAPSTPAFNVGYFNGDSIIQLPETWLSYGGTGDQNGDGRGTSFIAPKTSTVGEIRVSGYRNGSIVPSALGSVELWQLASNSLTAQPSTLLASVPLSITDIPPAPRNVISLDFSSFNITITAGVAYAVVVKSGTDWSTSTQYFSIATPFGGSDSEYDKFYGMLYTRSSNSFNTTNTSGTRFYISVLPAASNVKDSLTYTTTASGLRTEVEYAVDTNTALSTGKLAIHFEGTSGDAIYFSKPYHSLSSSNSGSTFTSGKIGIGFTAPKTGRLGQIVFTGFSSLNPGSTPVTDGAMELWSANALGGAGQTLLASIPYNPETYGSNFPADIFDFSTFPGADLVQGQAYILAAAAGTDWSSLNRYMSYSYGVSASASPIVGLSAGDGSVSRDSLKNLLDVYKASKGYYRYSNSTIPGQAPTAGALITPSSVVPTWNIFYSTTEITNGGFTTTADKLEVVTATGNGDSNFASGSVLENSTNATETETNTLNVNRDVTETGSAADSPSNNIVTANQTVLENNTSAADSLTGLPTYPVNITEAGSSQESSINSPAFSTTITENSTSASETETNTLNVNRDVTETGSAAESLIGNNNTANQTVTETGNAQETETNTVVDTAQIYESSNKNLLAPAAEDFSLWSKNASPNDYTVSTNVTTAPDGSNNADLIIKSTGVGSSSIVYKNFIVPSGRGQTNTQYVGSIYLKQAGYSKVQVNFGNTAFNGLSYGGTFDLAAGTTNTILSGSTVTITSAGNSWYRITVTGTTDADGGNYVFAWSTLDNSYNASYAGDGTSGIYAWGAMIEYGTVASTYTATSNADSSTTTWITSSALTENSPVTESSNQVIGQLSVITENNTSAADSPSNNIVTGNQTVTETGSAADSPTGSNSTTNQTVTEAGSAQESEFNSLVTGNQSITETGSAQESLLGANVSNRSLTETGTSQDSATGLPIYPVNITETGSAAESSTRSAFYAAALLELLTVTNSDSSTNTIVGIVNRLEALVNTLDSSSSNIQTTQSRTESLTPLEVLVGATITPQDITETSSAQDGVSAAKITFVVAVEQATGQESSTRVISVYSETFEAVTTTDSETALRFAEGLISEIVEALEVSAAFKFDAISYEDLIKSTTHASIYVGAGTALIYPMYVTAEVEVLTISAETAV